MSIIYYWSICGFVITFLIGYVYDKHTAGGKIPWPYRPWVIFLGGPLLWIIYSDEAWWRK